jgi:molybdopterin-guanine dinucleotide biosynthesis protein B
MKTFGLIGWSGSGKTTLMEKLIPELTGRGLKVSTMKHTHHNFEIDKPGKDSFKHRMAGATEVAVMSSSRWALVHELRAEDEPGVDAMIRRMTPVDLLLIEGFKTHGHPKIEVFRPSTREDMLQPSDPTVVAVATDEALDGVTVPVIDLNDVAAVADFILAHCGLEAADGAA